MVRRTDQEDRPHGRFCHLKQIFSEAVPKDVVFYNGMNGYEGHNLLTYLYAKKYLRMDEGNL